MKHGLHGEPMTCQVLTCLLYLLPVPTRLTYPISEQNLNQANYAAASTAIGGDEQTTKIFWEKTKKIVLVYNIKAALGSLLLSIPNRNISTR
jgi:hypothetical protein